jgi:hypothetical protein
MYASFVAKSFIIVGQLSETGSLKTVSSLRVGDNWNWRFF